MSVTEGIHNVNQVATDHSSQALEEAIVASWSKIAPFWPLKNLIAVSPVGGFEDKHFEEGLRQAQAYFQQKTFPLGMEKVNRQSIKWLQTFFDQGQSTISMPNRHLGFLKATLLLMRFDKWAHEKCAEKRQWLETAVECPETIIADMLKKLDIPSAQQAVFLTLMLTTLPGWAAHVQYRTQWADAQDAASPHTITKKEYLAFRLVLTWFLWPEAKKLLPWHQLALENADVSSACSEMVSKETNYQRALLKQLSDQEHSERLSKPAAQLVFCIDVRSEPFRRALEAQGDYDTYGFAGFFGLPVSIENTVTGESHASCPVLLQPAHTVCEQPCGSKEEAIQGFRHLQRVKKLYQSMKYTFTTPFSLVEAIGIVSGLWMGLRSFFPTLARHIQLGLKRAMGADYDVVPTTDSIPLEQQITYSQSALEMIGLTENFAPVIVFCGHGSTTQNNAYATSLDCGACGGRHGAPNARLLAAMLNAAGVREALQKKGLIIPRETVFIAAEHNTTTDSVTLFDAGMSDTKSRELERLKQDLARARCHNTAWRASELGVRGQAMRAQQSVAKRAFDWAEVRPEWGLARNAAFIVAPRSLTKNVDLDGRTFLHSYEWEKDPEGASLTTILTAPMVVAQWINAQYLFSSLDNVAYGGGSKITKNITGKIAIMQGNASDLMNGLPLQSVHSADHEVYHEPLRLTVIVCAPRTQIMPIIQAQAILQTLFGHGWVHLICLEPEDPQYYHLRRDFTWE